MNVHTMEHHYHNNDYLGATSGICAILSILDFQPYLTLIASLIAVVSGLISIYKKTSK